mgnify:CR=1 FL=1
MVEGYFEVHGVILRLARGWWLRLFTLTSLLSLLVNNLESTNDARAEFGVELVDGLHALGSDLETNISRVSRP